MADKAEGKEEKATVTRRQPANIPKVFQGDAATVRQEIYSTYGDKIGDQLANDLLAFVAKAVKGEYTEK